MRRESRWGDGLSGERLPGYRVVVTEQTRHGLANRHTFLLDEDTWDDPGGPQWRVETREHRAHSRVTMDGHRMRLGFGESLPDPINLTKGMDVPASTLVVILDALARGGRHRIFMADLKVIVSQLGSRISKFTMLPAAQQRLAESALYSEILRRCTTIDVVGES